MNAVKKEVLKSVSAGRSAFTDEGMTDPYDSVKILGYGLTTVTMEAVRTSETSVIFYEISRPNIPEDSHLHKCISLGTKV
jgi:hypothetical protein